jgi:hypothetical protein
MIPKKVVTITVTTMMTAVR